MKTLRTLALLSLAVAALSCVKEQHPRVRPEIYHKSDVEVKATEFNEDIVDIPELLVGDLLKKSGFYYDLDTRVLHVRNPKLLTDFQITKCYGAYADVDTR